MVEHLKVLISRAPKGDGGQSSLLTHSIYLLGGGGLMVEHLKVLMVEHLKVMAASRACLRILNSRACLRILMVEPPKGSLSVEPPKGSLSVEPRCRSLSVESLSLMLIGWPLSNK